VVSVRVGDVPDLLTVPERGVLVDRSPAALADGVETIAGRAHEPRRSLLPDELRASTVAGRLIEIYRAVLRDE
jgi:hypothetical protein